MTFCNSRTQRASRPGVHWIHMKCSCGRNARVLCLRGNIDRNRGFRTPGAAGGAGHPSDRPRARLTTGTVDSSGRAHDDRRIVDGRVFLRGKRQQHHNFANPTSLLGVALPTGPGASGLQPGQAFTSAAAGPSYGLLNSTVGKYVNMGTSRQIQLAVRFVF
jgi:hypothetical protein